MKRILIILLLAVDNVSKPELWVFPAFRPNGTVIIARRVGKSYIVKEFAQKEYKSYS